MDSHTLAFIAAALGAFVQELAHWHILRRKLDQKELRATLQSRAYYAVTILMIVASTIGSWLWFLPDIETPRTYLLTGAAFPVLVKRGIAAFLKDESELGPEAGSLRNYFKGA